MATAGAHLDAVLEAITKLRTAVSKVVTRDLLRRLFSRAMVDLCLELKAHCWRSGPVIRERTADVLHTLRHANWHRAWNGPRKFTFELTHELLDTLGGTTVKLAQVIAHSPGLFAQPLVDACKDSLSAAHVSPVPADAVRALIEAELGAPLGTLFSRFDSKPLACASIAQVHTAALLGGEEVVVKVVRPGVRERLEADLGLATLLARLVDLLLGADLVAELVSSSLGAMVGSLADGIVAETDLGIEASNMLAFEAWRASSPSLKRARLATAVLVPAVYTHASSERILTMQRLEGPLISACASVARDGRSEALHEGWRVALCRAMAVAAVSIVDPEGLFHADLHMGNLIYLPQTHQIGLLDFGVCGRLPPWLRGALLLQALSFSTGEEALLVEGFAYAMRTRPEPAAAFDTAALTATLRPLLAELAPINPLGRPGADVDPKLYALVGRGQVALLEHGVQLPHEFTLLIKLLVFFCGYLALFDQDELASLATSLSAAALGLCASHTGELRALVPAEQQAKVTRKLARRATEGACLIARASARRRATAAAAAWKRAAPSRAAALVSVAVLVVAAMACGASGEWPEMPTNSTWLHVGDVAGLAGGNLSLPIVPGQLLA